MKTVKFIWIVIFALSLSCHLSAASPSARFEPSLGQSTVSLPEIKMLKGVVKSGEETLPGVAIEINGKKHYTDLDGRFDIPLSLSSGQGKLKVSLISYQTQEIILSSTAVSEDLQIQLLQ